MRKPRKPDARLGGAVDETARSLRPVPLAHAYLPYLEPENVAVTLSYHVASATVPTLRLH